MREILRWEGAGPRVLTLRPQGRGRTQPRAQLLSTPGTLLAHQSCCCCCWPSLHSPVLPDPRPRALRPDWSLGVSEGVRPWLGWPFLSPWQLLAGEGEHLQEPLSNSFSENPSGSDRGSGRSVQVSAQPVRLVMGFPHPYPTPSRNGVRTTQRARGGELRKRVAPLGGLREGREPAGHRDPPGLRQSLLCSLSGPWGGSTRISIFLAITALKRAEGGAEPEGEWMGGRSGSIARGDGHSSGTATCSVSGAVCAAEVSSACEAHLSWGSSGEHPPHQSFSKCLSVLYLVPEMVLGAGC